MIWLNALFKCEGRRDGFHEGIISEFYFFMGVGNLYPCYVGKNAGRGLRS